MLEMCKVKFPLCFN